MVAVGSRRVLLSAATAATTALIHSDTSSSSPDLLLKSTTTAGAIGKSLLSDIITNCTPLSFRLAVAKTGRFLYRGEEEGGEENNSSNVDDIIHGQFRILTPEPDLLSPGTYDDPDAVAYFQCLERRLMVVGKNRVNNNNNNNKVDSEGLVALPSTGHIGTSDIVEASQWGEAVSVWPLGASFSYVWPKQNNVFFPPSSSSPAAAGARGGKGCRKDELAINQDLDTALTLGHEVLFVTSFDDSSYRALEKTRPSFLPDRSSKSAFLAVSTRYDKELMGIIKQTSNYVALQNWGMGRAE